MRKKICLTVLLFTGLIPALWAQSGSDKAHLQKERQDIQNELKQMQAMYANVKGQAKLSIKQLNILKKKMELQERYIGSINKELKMIDNDIYYNNVEIYRLQRQVDTLKSQYARTVVYAYKSRSSYDYVNFIFSATSFNDAIRRISYLKSYRAYREKQLNTILETQQLITKRQKEQLSRKEQKNIALQTSAKERIILTDQKKEKGVMVANLTLQEKDLHKQINEKKKRDKDLQNSILSIIRRDIENGKKEVARKDVIKKADDEKMNGAKANSSIKPVNPTKGLISPSKKPGSYLELNVKDAALGTDFGNSRGKLPWPVDNGFVNIHFGVYTIPGTPIKGNNPGITIATESAGNPVKAIFDGEVSGIETRGDIGIIYIRHGKYYTVYSNLSAISVTKGAMVKKGQVIGRVGEDVEGSGGQLDFILMIESENVNPEQWLRH